MRAAKPGPDLAHERAALAQGARVIAGVDEVGRGPLAGPVTAAAVILGPNPPEGLDDSKKLSRPRREALAAAIKETCIWSCAHVSVEVIAEINILQAAHLAMRRAVEGLVQAPDFLLIDGVHLPKTLPCPAQAVVRGDARSLSIAAASIVAKVERDRLMVDLAQQHPGYGWDHNAGYGTSEHLAALKNLGVTPYHRRGFAPVHNILCKEYSSRR